jgi:hypothetical protein
MSVQPRTEDRTRTGPLQIGDVLVFASERRTITDRDPGCYWLGDRYVRRQAVHEAIAQGRVGLDQRGSP